MVPESGRVNLVGFPDFDVTPDLACRIKRAFEIQERARRPFPSAHDLLEAISDHPWVVRTATMLGEITEREWHSRVKRAPDGDNERDRGPITVDLILSTAATVAEGGVVGTEEVFVACGYQMSSPFGGDFHGEMFRSILRMERMVRGLNESDPTYLRDG